jgi:CRP-like cAMP-binding protein
MGYALDNFRYTCCSVVVRPGRRGQRSIVSSLGRWFIAAVVLIVNLALTGIALKRASRRDTIMIQEIPQAERFKRQLRDSLRCEIQNARAITIAKHDHVYRSGDQDEMIYFIESGQIKLQMLSPGGRECLLAIHAAGDIFGELCLAGLVARLETATAMEETILKRIPCSQCFAWLSRDALFEGFVQYLAVRITEQQQMIANLMVDSEHRRGKTLLQLARNLGKKDH